MGSNLIKWTMDRFLACNNVRVHLSFHLELLIDSDPSFCSCRPFRWETDDPSVGTIHKFASRCCCRLLHLSSWSRSKFLISFLFPPSAHFFFCSFVVPWFPVSLMIDQWGDSFVVNGLSSPQKRTNQRLRCRDSSFFSSDNRRFVVRRLLTASTCDVERSRMFRSAHVELMTENDVSTWRRGCQLNRNPMARWCADKFCVNLAVT